MSLAIIFTMAAVSVSAFLITLSRVVGWSWIIRRATLIDVVFTLGTGLVLGFTIYGILIAVLAGLMMAVVLSCLKRAVAIKDRVYSAPTRDQEFNESGWVYNQAPYV